MSIDLPARWMLRRASMRSSAILAGILCSGMLHCVPPAASGVARSRAAADLACPEEKVVAYRAGEGRYVARGCGRWTEYDCLSSGRGTVYAETVCTARSQPIVHEESASR
jgi:hypothetical protein